VVDASTFPKAGADSCGVARPGTQSGRTISHDDSRSAGNRASAATAFASRASCSSWRCTSRYACVIASPFVAATSATFFRLALGMRAGGAVRPGCWRSACYG
jgi:hypothetical protein